MLVNTAFWPSKTSLQPHRTNREDSTHPRWFAHRLGPDLGDSIIVTTGRYAYRREPTCRSILVWTLGERVGIVVW